MAEARLLVVCMLFAFSFASECNVLVFAGEGDASPYQVGALKGLIESQSQNATKYDLVQGISSGAINAAVLAQYPMGKESEFVGKMTAFWTNFTKSQFYLERENASLLTWLEYPGYYDTTPMNKTITGLLGTGTPQRNLIIGATNMEYASYESFSSNTPEDWVAVTMASMATPGWFPWVSYKGQFLVDGAQYKQVDMVGVVNECKALGYTTAQIHVDILIAAKLTIDTANASNYNTLQVLKRHMSLSSFTHTIQFINYARDGYFGPGITVRIVHPTKDIPNDGNGLYEYSKEQIEQLIADGEADAKIVISEEKSGEKAITFLAFE